MATDAANIVLGAIIEKAITPVVDVIGRHLGYLFCYKSNIKNLGTTAAQLEKSRNDADNFFKGQKWNNEEIAHSSVGWLEEVEKVIKDAKEVEDATAKLNGCLNLKGRYVQSRRSTKLAVEIQTLQNKAPKGITTNTILPAGRIRGALANEASKGYKTRMETMDEVMKALEDHAISVIGICGLGGVGKTTLVHELRDRVRKQNLFNEVAMTSVSQNVDVFKIQGDLAEMLGLIRLKEEKNVIARADQLQKRLTNGNKVLVILDDVWSDIKLKDIGIPVGSGHIRCKVLITSRQKDVCTGIQMNIEVKVLPKEEARAMFRERAGDCVDRDNLEDIANDIADRCGGLPVALLALSRALSNKDRRLWVDAHTRLRDGSLPSIHGMEKQVYQSIKLSYDFLAIEKQEEAQSLLLLCSQHPEDAEIEIEKLARYCLSLGLFEGITEVTRARNRVYTLIELLKSCFLLQAVDVEKVRVHGFVRDVCLSTVKVERDRVYMHFWKQEGDVGIVTRDIDYQKLKILVEVPLYHDDISGIISFLEQMQELRVLESCRDFSLFSLRAQNADPSWALQFLTNLRMLSLEDTNVLPALMSEFTRLKKLETLSFLGSTVSSFPHKIGQLSNLKLLDLRYEFSSETSMMPIPSGILPNLTKLEVLFMGKHHFSGAVPYEDEDDMDKESCHGRIEELDSLTNLTTLQVDFLDPMQLLDLKNFRFEKLEGFIFGSGGKSLPFVYCDRYPLFMKNICLREVGMEWVFGDQIQSIVRSTVDLSLEDIKDWYDPLVFKQFSSLKKLEMTGCHQLEYIIHDGNGDDSRSSNAFINVEILRILDMENVGELCHNGNLPSGSLRKLQLLEIHSLSNMRHLWVGPTDPLCLVNLKVVIIKYCETLKCLFPHSAAKGLSQLQSLNVESCGMLEEILSRGDGTATREGEISEESNDLLIHFSKLTNVIINESPNLRSFYNLDDGRGQSFFNSVGILHSIENVEVYENHSIKAVFDFEGLQATTMNDEAPSLLCKLQAVVLFRLSKLEHICRQIPKRVHIFQNLGTLDVVDCGSLAYLIPSSIAHMLVNLQKIVVKGCKGMREVISKMNEEDCGVLDKKIIFRSLRSLELEDLENLSSFCPIDQAVFEFPSLEELSIIECPVIETFCCQGLRVVSSGMLEENVSNGEETTKGGGEVKKVPSDLVTQFPKLKKLTVHRAPNLRGFYNLDNDKGYQHQMVMLPSLEELDVFQNHSLKTVFDFEGLEGMTMREDAHSLLCKLHRIVIWDLPKLEHFCKKVPKGFHIFQNLDTLDVEDCGGLAYLIPSSIAHMLMNLRLLTVKGCKGMKEVFKMNEEDCGMLENKTVFRSLRIVKLEDLGSLSSFFSTDQMVLEFPSLEELSIIECPEMETFCCQIPRIAHSGMLEENLSTGKGTTKGGGGGGGEGEERKKVPSNLVVQFPKLEELILKGTPNLRGFYNLDNDEGYHQLNVATPELRSIDVRRCDRLVSIAASSSLKLRQNLKHVRLMNCKATKAVVDFEGFEVTSEDAHSVLNNLEAIWLRELPNIEHICRLVPKEVYGFQNLTSLHAYRCHGPSYLLTSTMAHMLLNLKFLIVWDCNSMKEVIKVNEDCGEKKIVFRSLHYVFLSSEKLSSFCSSELQEFDFPSMTQVYIVKCPEMTTFCFGNLTAEKLRGVHFDDKNDDDYNNYEEGEYDDYFDDSDNNDDSGIEIF